MKLGVDDERIENTLPYINKTDEFWDYERQVCIKPFILELIDLSLRLSCEFPERWDFILLKMI